MAGLLVSFRFCVFVIFIICNAIICSVGVWSISLAKFVGFNYQISVYLVFLGAFSLLCIFPIIFIDLVRKNAITSRVWFECAWIGLFWVMELSGAAAVSADMPDVMCSVQVQRLVMEACTSTKVLMVFTWICTGTLLAYLVALTTSAIYHQSIDKQVWHAPARDFAWFATRSSLGSAPASPVVEKGQSLRMVAPQPKRPMPPMNLEPPVLHSREAAPASVQQPPPVHGHNPIRPAYIPAAAPVPAPVQASTYRRPELPKLSTVPSLYPEQIQSAIPSSARSSLLMQSALVEPSPSPLGDWPRKKIPGQHIRRKPPPPPLPLAATASVVSRDITSSTVRDNGTRYPRGPRPGSQRQLREINRAPPLNLNDTNSLR